MKKIIRERSFETNSSSMHSIVVTKNNSIVTEDDLLNDNDNEDTIYVRENGTWTLWGTGENFGRHPFRILTMFQDKLRYAMSEYLGYINPSYPEWDEYIDMFVGIIKEVCPAVKTVKFGDTTEYEIWLDEDGNELSERDLFYTGYKDGEPVYIYKDDDGTEHQAHRDEEYYYDAPEFGVVDHQSMGLLRNFLKHKGISLKDFLINRKYKVIIDGDEYWDWIKIKNSGLINIGEIEEEYTG